MLWPLSACASSTRDSSTRSCAVIDGKPSLRMCMVCDYLFPQSEDGNAAGFTNFGHEVMEVYIKHGLKRAMAELVMYKLAKEED